jgi:hypothetical protein
MSASIPRGFVAKLIGSDGFVDRKIFSAMSAAINFVTGEGLKNFEGDVERAEVISPTGELVWHKSKVSIGKADHQHLNRKCCVTTVRKSPCTMSILSMMTTSHGFGSAALAAKNVDMRRLESESVAVIKVSECLLDSRSRRVRHGQIG